MRWRTVVGLVIAAIGLATYVRAAVGARAASDGRELRRFAEPPPAAPGEVTVLRGADGATWHLPLDAAKPGERGFDPQRLGEPDGHTRFAAE